jgi:hypothetical protein
MGDLLSRELNVTQPGDSFVALVEQGSGMAINASLAVEVRVDPTSHTLYHCFGRVQTNACTMTDADYVVLGVLGAGLLLALLVGCWACLTPATPSVVRVVDRRPSQRGAYPNYAPFPPHTHQCVPHAHSGYGASPEELAAAAALLPEKQPLLKVSVDGLLM